eukprot:1139621-Pelagomonas_calceolata.AAC.4
MGICAELKVFRFILKRWHGPEGELGRPHIATDSLFHSTKSESKHCIQSFIASMSKAISS